MRLAEQIIRILDAAKDKESEDWDNPEIARYASLIKTQYSVNKEKHDFTTASLMARVSVIDGLLKSKVEDAVTDVLVGGEFV